MNSSIMQLAKSSNAVEAGFLAAGITVWTMAAAQALGILLSWTIFGI